MGLKKLVGWECPVFGHVFSKLMGLKKLVGWEYPIFGHVFSKLTVCVKLVGTGAGAGAPSIKKLFQN